MVTATVVRMFISKLDTVRWEARVNGARGLELHVSGPGVLRRTCLFADPLSSVEYQSQFEQQLLEHGYLASPIPDRRSGYDRRTRPRRGPDRRLTA